MPVLNRLSNTHYITHTLFLNTLPSSVSLCLSSHLAPVSHACLIVYRSLYPFMIFYPLSFLFFYSHRVQCRKIKLLTEETFKPRFVIGCWVSVTVLLWVCEGECKPILPPPPMSSVTREFKFNKMVYFNSDEYILDLQDSHQVHCWQHNQNSRRMQVVRSYTVCCLRCASQVWK